VTHETTAPDPEDRRFNALSTFLSSGMGYTLTRGQIVGALAAARRAVVVNRAHERLLKEWLQSETRVRGIRENAAVLAVMEIPEFREEVAREYLREHPERSQALDELITYFLPR
jgi:hypothetical protein